MARNTYNQDEELQTGFNKEHMKRLLSYIKPYKREVAVAVILMLIGSVLSLLGPLFIALALDTLIPNEDVNGLIVTSAVYLLTIWGVSAIMRYRIKSMGEVGQNILVDMRSDLFKNLQRLPFSFYDSKPQGKILVRVVNYINSLSDLLTNGFVTMIADLFTLVMTVVFMLLLDVRLTVVALLAVPVLVGFVIPLKKYQRIAFQKLSTKQSNMNAYVHESINGMNVTQAFSREWQNMKIYEDVCNQYRGAWMKAVQVMFLIWPAIDIVAALSSISLYLVVVYVLNLSVSAGVLVGFLGYVWRFWAPITNMGNFYNNLINATAYLERIFELMDEEPLVKDIEGATKLPQIEGEVTFKDVTFAYEPDNPILKGINFTAKPGERIAIVGPTGSGKTTIINLISRFYNIEKGEVLIDGNDISKVTLKSLREQMGIMMQDSFIFSGTIIDNIRYGKLDATEEEVIEAAKVVCAHDFIVNLEEGYYTKVNERGTRLSAGQRQLISFARALLADPKILILDEATSSIDTQTEILLQQGLERLLKGRTSFIIAHRLSTIKNSDRIMYINEGVIKESGNHDQLMDQGGYYHELYQSQYKMFQAV